MNFFKCLLPSGFPIGQTSQVSTYQRETRGGSLYKSTFHLINRNTHTHVNTYICVQVWYGGGDKGRPDTGTGGSSPSSMVSDLVMAMIKMMIKMMILKNLVSGILHFAMPTRLLKSDCLPGSSHTIWDVSRKDSDKDWYVQLSMICLSNQNSVRYALLVSNLKQINGREKFPEESLKTKLQESLGRVIYKMKR